MSERLDKIISKGVDKWAQRRLNEIYNYAVEGRYEWPKNDLDALADYLGRERFDIDDRFILKFGQNKRRDIRTLEISYLVYLCGPSGRVQLDGEQLKLVRETLCKKAKGNQYALQLAAV